MNEILVDATLTKTFAQDLLTGHGADIDEAAVVTEALIWSDSRGQPNHGLFRLPMIVRRQRAGGIRSPCHAEFHKLGRAAEALEGHGGFGQYLAVLAMRRAISIARSEGVSVVAVRDSNHLGAAGYYANLAARKGMVALIASNSYPTVAAFGGIEPVLGTNPMAFGVPRREGEPLIIDMGTTFHSRMETLADASRVGRLAEGVAIDRHGNPVRNVEKLAEGTLLPLGARGFVLGLMVEILSGILTGAGYSTELHSFYREPDHPGRLGHFIFCLDVETFMSRERFLNRMEHLIELLMSSRNMNAESPVRLPGEEKWRVHQKNESAGVIPLNEQTAATLESLGSEIDLIPPWRLSESLPETCMSYAVGSMGER